MPTRHRKTRDGRDRTTNAAGSPASTDAAWQALVEQLLTTPSQQDPDEPEHPEYEWARKLGWHINRPPKRR